MSKANPNRVYALIETGRGIPWNGQPTDAGTLWRSDDGGANWKLINSTGNLLARPAYYTRMVAEPDNADQAYFLAIGFSSTHDGGATLDRRTTDRSPGFDNHDMWIDPLNGKRMVVANDEGVSISITRGESWTRIRLPIAQIYHVTTDNQVPYYVCGNMQDGPSTCGPSDSRKDGTIGGDVTGSAEIPRGLWYSVGGGESGWATPDPVDPSLIWTSASNKGPEGGIVVVYDTKTRKTRDVDIWPVSPNGHAPADVRYRFVWDFPLFISPHDHNRIYAGSQFLHVTTNRGQSWQVVSPDLTLNDKTRQQHSGGLTGDNIGVEYGDVIYSIAESPITAGVIWVGTNDGLVQVTRDAGKTWTNVTKNIPNIFPWGTINNIDPSPFNASTAYITVNAHQEGNFDPWVYKTNDYGQSWKLIVDGLPKTPVGYTRCVREDPVRKGLLYLGTENGLYVSFNDGEHWQPLQLNLPHVPVSWITIQKQFNDLVISTYGRGFYILDDLSPFQQIDSNVAATDAHLFLPRPAYRFRTTASGVREAADDPNAGHNPSYGALLSYWLGSVPSGDVAITIQDPAGKTVRKLNGIKVAGINRVNWDLRFDPASPYIPPPPPPSGPTPPAGPEEGMPGPVPTAGRPQGPPPSVRLLAPPGKYTVKLAVAGHEFSQPLTVIKDPNSGGSIEEISQQTTMLLDLAGDLNTATLLTNGIQEVRGKLRDFVKASAENPSLNDLAAMATALEQKFSAAEDKLRQQKAVAFYEWPVELTAKFVYLVGHVQSSDHMPTDQAREAQAFLKEQLASVKDGYQTMIQTDLALLNTALASRGEKPIPSPKP